MAGIGALLTVLGLCAYAAYWFAIGGRWLVVQTPSMGTAAPVGTLLWVEPVEGPVHVGDVVSFHPPGRSEVTFTHRVHAIHPDGAIVTQGDANPARDPWTLHRDDVTGRVAMRWWAVGWLLRVAPILVIGGLALLVLVRRFTAERWKLPALTIGVAVLVTLPIWLYRPLVRAQLLLFEHVGAGAHPAARATYVSTGLLPTRLSASGGRSLVLHNGESGTVVSTVVDAKGKFSASVVPHLPWTLWVALVLACFLPALWSAAVGVTPERARVRGGPAVAAG